ncbi:MAG: hypothetical protein HFE63_04830 [Clostridiales bacterium]|nr:hypothetical protein [Clostridiales bacterium]
MKLLLKQKFSWFDSYKIYRMPENTLVDEYDYPDSDIEFIVESQLAWGHKFNVSDRSGNMVGTLEQRVFTFLPAFDIYIGGECIGSVEKEFTFFKPSFTLDFRGWQVDGDIFEWDYNITDSSGNVIARITKELFHFMDTYTIDVYDDRDAVCALMVVLAIDAEKCGR